MLDLLLKGLALGLLLSLAVGPILFTTLKQSINNGVWGGLAFIAGVSAADACLAIASLYFTELFATLVAQKEWVALGGSIFLVGTGIYFLFFKKVKLNSDGVQVMPRRKRDYFKLFLTGLLMNGLNPLIMGFWLATSTTLADHSIRQRFFIFGVALLFVVLADTGKVLLANRIRQRLTVRNIQLLNRLNGLLLIIFGVVLLAGVLFFGDKWPGS